MTVHLNDLSEDLSLSSAPVGFVPTQRRRGIYRNGLKRLFDVVAILVTSVAIVPVIFILALIVARDGHNPFYSSERVGRNGRTFRMLKLRTMVPDADALLERYLSENAAARAEWDATQKLKNDPRITLLGRFLRKSSMDELPQIWNVLVGDMSVVGPRPMMPSQRAMYHGLSYYALRPGMTGPWQVSMRNDGGFTDRCDFDREYDRDLSFPHDLSLILRTFSVIFRGTGY